MTASEQLVNLQRPTDFVKENQGFITNSGMQWRLRHRDINELSESGSVMKILNRLFLHKERFAKFLLSRLA